MSNLSPIRGGHDRRGTQVETAYIITDETGRIVAVTPNPVVAWDWAVTFQGEWEELPVEECSRRLREQDRQRAVG